MKVELDWGAIMVARQPSFLKATYVLEIGGGDFSRLFSLARKYPEKQFFGIDFDYSAAAQNSVKKNSDIKNAHVIKLNATRSIFADDLFDFSFSIAVGEHIAELQIFLSEMSRVIRDKGVYYFVQAPFWTSYKGHHYHHGDAAIVEVLGGYKHLRYNPDQMKDYLINIGWSSDRCDDCVHRIYERDDLSRLSPTETKSIIESSKFSIEFWRDIDDENFNPIIANETVAQLRHVYSLYDLKTKGAEVLLVNQKK